MTQLLKVHGSMNSFFLLDQTQLNTSLTDQELIQLTKKITDPDNGILNGADGLLVVNRPTRKDAIAQMRVINADGSEASMCGNGLRTVARYVAERDHRTQFEIDTMNANLRVRHADDFAPGISAFAVEISPVSFERQKLPFANLGHDRLINTYVPELLPGLKFTSIAVPNPHLISFVEDKDLSDEVLGELGQRLNTPNPYFPDGVNINFAKILGKNQLFVRTFERGVGFTNACGTGMSATSLAFALTNPGQASFNQPITVYNPGGMVKTVVHHDHGNYWIELIGNATFTHQIEVSENDLHQADLNNITTQSTGEQAAYDRFAQHLPKLF